MHQRILRSFAEIGRAPNLAELDAAPYDRTVEQVLADLHVQDFLRLGGDGQVLAAYPFPAVPTPHRVTIIGGPQVYAMCAIDALGISAMLGRATRIDTVDPTNGEPITVGESWEPADAVVFAGQVASREPSDAQAACCDTSAAEVCCGYVNFFASSASAQAWAATHRQVAGQILPQNQALALGTAIFGPLLTEGVS